MLIVAFLLSLGPIIHLAKVKLFYGPYYLLYQLFPGFDGIRVPARLAIMVLFALSVLAGLGATKLLGAISLKSGRFLFIFALITFVLIESFSGPIYHFKLPVGKDIPEVYRWLADQEEEFAFIELPWRLGWSNGLSMYYSTYHWKKLVNGYSGYVPKAYEYTSFILMLGFPSDTAMKILEEFGVRYVLFHSQEYQSEDWEKVIKALGRYKDRLRLVKDFSPDIVYEIVSHERKRIEKIPATKDVLEIPRDSWRAYSNPIGDASSAIDGNIATRWRTDRPQKPGDIFVLDLGMSYKLARVNMYLGDSWNDFPRMYKVEVSLDGKIWKVVNNRSEGIVPLIKGLVEDGRNLYLAIEIQPVVGRYLKITQTGSDPDYYWSIHELKVFASKKILER